VTRNSHTEVLVEHAGLPTQGMMFQADNTSESMTLLYSENAQILRHEPPLRLIGCTGVHEQLQPFGWSWNSVLRLSAVTLRFLNRNIPSHIKVFIEVRSRSRWNPHSLATFAVHRMNHNRYPKRGDFIPYSGDCARIINSRNNVGHIQQAVIIY
jgi:hypothetical protein